MRIVKRNHLQAERKHLRFGKSTEENIYPGSFELSGFSITLISLWSLLQLLKTHPEVDDRETLMSDKQGREALPNNSPPDSSSKPSFVEAFKVSLVNSIY